MLTQQHIHIASTQLYSHAYIHAFIDACICPFNIGHDIMLSKYIHGNGYMHVDAAHKGIHDALHFPYVPPSSHVYLSVQVFFHLPVAQCIIYNNYCVCVCSRMHCDHNACRPAR